MTLQITHTAYMKHIYTLSFMFIVLLISCDSRQKVEESIVIDNEAEVIEPTREIKSFDISPILDTIKFVKLELTEHSIIGEINKVLVFEDRIYVFDKLTHTLFVYNMNGRFIFKISQMGRGPGEYTQLDFFDINYETRQIVLTDLMSYRILYYDLKGKYISEQKIPFWVEGISPAFSKGIIAYANFRNNKSKFEHEYNVYYLDSMMNILKGYFPYNSDIFYNPRISFATPQSGNFYTYKQIPHFFTDYKNMLYQITENGLSPKYLIDFGDKIFREEFLSKSNAALKNYIEQGEFYELGVVLENDDFVIFTYYESSFPIISTVYYSKVSKNLMEGVNFIVGDDDNYFYTNNIFAYDSWIIATIKPEDLISWAKNVEEKRISPDTEYGIIKKKMADDVTLEDNEVLMFYKLKQF